MILQLANLFTNTLSVMQFNEVHNKSLLIVVLVLPSIDSILVYSFNINNWLFLHKEIDY